MTGKRMAFPAWLKKIQAKENIVISTRVRLARNVKTYRFPHAMEKKEREKFLGEVESFMRAHEGKPLVMFNRLRDLDNVYRGVLAERGLVHMESAREPDFTGLATGPGQTTSVIINEEDHFRLQVIHEGLNLEKSLKDAQLLDELVSRGFDLASHREFGFLTACPTNVGTGLRASVMLHLPALTLTRGIVQVLQAVLHMGLAVRGFYGEGTELRSVFFQVSNQMTLGRTEEEIIRHLLGVTRQIVERENEARQKLLKDDPKLLEDKIGRAVGIVSRCRLLGFEEALDLLSTLRLGSELGLLKNLPRAILNELLLQIQPAHLQLLTKKTLGGKEEYLRRAEWVQKRLKGCLPGG
ncbi:ATP--guanido phosphotransferase [candidate division FCPU426 bacterium]|nr:ATP--guanido phosphotransferase [candidate division FCPU426 bacterium]